MDGCEPGHEWRAEREMVNFVRFRCGTCGSVCVAPKPVDQLGLDVRRAPAPRRAPTGPRSRVEVPRWASVATSSSPTAG